MATINLNWTASANKDWITINPTEGNGNAKISVTVNPAPPGQLDDLYGVITITCLDCEPPLNIKTINVTRCATECEYETTAYKTVYHNPSAINNASECGGSSSVTWNYTEYYKSTNGCADKTQDRYATTEVSWGEYVEGTTMPLEKYYPSEDTENHATLFIYQNTEHCHTPVECNCISDIVVTNGLSWGYDETNYKDVVVNINKTECGSVTGCTITSGEDHFETGGTLESITVHPKEENQGTSSITGELTIFIGDDCEKTVLLTHNSSNCAGGPTSINGDIEISCEGGTFTYTLQF